MPAVWVPFRRRDLTVPTRAVAAVAVSGDAGVHGHGVEVVLESPRRRWWGRLFDRAPRNQARIAVTGAGGAAGYPIHVRLITGYGAGAAGRVDRRDRWATSVTGVLRPDATSGEPVVHGEAILMLKRGTAVGGYEPGDAAGEVVAGTVAALADLRPFTPDRGWRYRVDRDVRRR